jgi:hypothetical protein
MEQSKVPSLKNIKGPFNMKENYNQDFEEIHNQSTEEKSFSLAPLSPRLRKNECFTHYKIMLKKNNTVISR